MKINKNFVHQVGDQPRLYYDARSTNHQDLYIRIVLDRVNINLQQFSYLKSVVDLLRNCQQSLLLVLC
jgi:hypothetical protein